MTSKATMSSSLSSPPAATSPSACTGRSANIASPAKARKESLRAMESVPPAGAAAELTREQLKDNVLHQLNEIEMLENIYCQPGEIELSDPLIKEEINDFVYGRLKVAPIAPQITMRIKCNGGDDEQNRYGSNENINENLAVAQQEVVLLLLEISIELPVAYPICASPSIHVRLPRELAPRRQLRFLQRRLNSEVERWVQTWHKLNHETCLLQVLSWLDQNAFSYISTTSSSFARRLAFETDDDDGSSSSNNDADEGNEGDLDVADDDDAAATVMAVAQPDADSNSKTLKLQSRRRTAQQQNDAQRDSDEEVSSSAAAKSPTTEKTSEETTLTNAASQNRVAATSTLQPRAGRSSQNHLQPATAAARLLSANAAAGSSSSSTRRRMRVEDSGCSNGDSSSVNQCGAPEDEGNDEENDDDDEDVIAADDEEEEEDETVLTLLDACDSKRTKTGTDSSAVAAATAQIPRSNSLISGSSSSVVDAAGRAAKKLAKNLSSATQSGTTKSAAQQQQQQPPSPPPALSAIPRSPSLGSRTGLRMTRNNTGIERRTAFNLNFGARKPQEQERSANEQVVFERLWIHSHHIKAKSKREFLLAKAKQLDLSGFTRAGKPGIICVEGRREDCREFWEQCRRLNWQKISLRYEEQHVLTLARLETSSIDDYRRFKGFREVAFSRAGGLVAAADDAGSVADDVGGADDDAASSSSSLSSSRMAAFIAWLVEHQSTEAIPYILGFTPSDQHLTMLLASVRNAKKAEASKSSKRSSHHHRLHGSSSSSAAAAEKASKKHDVANVKEKKQEKKPISSAASTASSSSSEPADGKTKSKSSPANVDANISPKKTSSPKKTVTVPYVRSSSAMESATPAAATTNHVVAGHRDNKNSSPRLSPLLRPFSDDNTEA